MKNSSKKMNQTKKCQEKRYDDSACNRPLYNEQYCIFHSENIEQKKEDFEKAFWVEFERQKKENMCYDFSRFIFPDSISFEAIEFDKDVYFDFAQFTGEETSFLGAKFTGNNTSFMASKFTGKNILFSSAQFAGDWLSFNFTEFKGETTLFSDVEFTSEENSFRATKFKGKITFFDNAQFAGKNTIFRFAKFTGMSTSFEGAQFTGEETIFDMGQFASKLTSFQGAQFIANMTSFADARFTGKITFFDRVQFTGARTLFIETQFTSERTLFYATKFTGQVTFNSANFKNVWNLFESLTKEKKWLLLKTKRYLIKDWRFYLQEETANRHPLIKRMVNDTRYLDEFKKRHPIVYFIWKITSNCGRSMLLWAAWSLGIAIGFGLKFMQMGPEAFELRHVPTKFSFFYYSIVTFTTLGFGDITPKTLTTEILVTIEVILGYIMLGGLISILANKLARRS